MQKEQITAGVPAHEYRVTVQNWCVDRASSDFMWAASVNGWEIARSPLRRFVRRQINAVLEHGGVPNHAETVAELLRQAKVHGYAEDTLHGTGEWSHG